MEIERLNVVLVPRRPWAALDLGFALGRAWFFRLLLAWAVIAVPVFFLALLLRPWGLWVAMWLLWWLKPAYEQLPLYVLSRAVFDDPPRFREVLRQTWVWVRRGLLGNLTWRRLAVSRSFAAPVLQLEGLRGQARSARLKILHEHGNAGAWLTMVGAHFETLLYGCGLIAGYALLPEEFSLREDLLGEEAFVETAQLLLVFLAMAVMAPFYVAGGFSLYLHRRAQLEGWDIELVFRRLRARLMSTRISAAVLLPVLVSLLMLSAFISTPTVHAEEPAENIVATRGSAAEVIAEVLQDPDFGTKRTLTGWRLKTPNTEKEKNINPPAWLIWIARASELLMWLAIAGLIVYVLYRLPQWLARVPRRSAATSKHVAPVTTLFGLDVREESLPADIPGAARALADRGEVRQALALLYRGALNMLIKRSDMSFRDGHTEGDCLGLVRKACPQPLSDFFASLTRDWQRTAYGHVLPSVAQLHSHCHYWKEYFGARS